MTQRLVVHRNYFVFRRSCSVKLVIDVIAAQSTIIIEMPQDVVLICRGWSEGGSRLSTIFWQKFMLMHGIMLGVV